MLFLQEFYKKNLYEEAYLYKFLVICNLLSYMFKFTRNLYKICTLFTNKSLRDLHVNIAALSRDEREKGEDMVGIYVIADASGRVYYVGKSK